LGAGAAFDFFKRVVFGLGHLVRAVMRDDVVGVDNRQNPRELGDLLTVQAVRITGSVPVLVVVQDQLGDAAQLRR